MYTLIMQSRSVTKIVNFCIRQIQPINQPSMYQINQPTNPSVTSYTRDLRTSLATPDYQPLTILVRSIFIVVRLCTFSIEAYRGSNKLVTAKLTKPSLLLSMCKQCGNGTYKTKVNNASDWLVSLLQVIDRSDHCAQSMISHADC